MAQPRVYMLANRYRGTLQIGTSIQLEALIAEKKAQKAANPFADIPTLLVWFENCGDLGDAKRREEELHRLSRDFRLAIVERQNPQWRELELPVAVKPAPTHRPTLRRLPLSARQFL